MSFSQQYFAISENSWAGLELTYCKSTLRPFALFYSANYLQYNRMPGQFIQHHWLEGLAFCYQEAEHAPQTSISDAQGDWTLVKSWFLTSSPLCSRGITCWRFDDIDLGHHPQVHIWKGLALLCTMIRSPWIFMIWKQVSRTIVIFVLGTKKCACTRPSFHLTSPGPSRPSIDVGERSLHFNHWPVSFLKTIMRKMFREHTQHRITFHLEQT